MPPKSKEQGPSKKAVRAKSAKAIEDSTFGLKNKNKSAKVYNSTCNHITVIETEDVLLQFYSWLKMHLQTVSYFFNRYNNLSRELKRVSKTIVGQQMR